MIVLIGWRFLQVMTVGRELSITPIRIGISHRFVQLVNVAFFRWYKLDGSEKCAWVPFGDS